MSVFDFQSCPRRPATFLLTVMTSNSKLEAFEVISSRKVSLSLRPSITRFNIHAWLSIAVPTSRKTSSWVMMSFSKAETLERICLMEVSASSQSLSLRARESMDSRVRG